MSESDLQLLTRYARQDAEEAFAEIVRRHLGLVHSAALRQVRSTPLAEEVAQSVFLDLARNAGRLQPDTVVSAWLYQVTRRTAIDVVRRESRRQAREQLVQEITAMHTADADADWTRIEPLLDEAMASLDETDRAAVLLRYFENKSLREVGQTLGTSDDAAQKRVSRAIERLRAFLAKSGVGVGVGGLAAAISAHAVHAAPVGLAATVCAAIAVFGKTTALAGATFWGSLKGSLTLAGGAALLAILAVCVAHLDIGATAPEAAAATVSSMRTELDGLSVGQHGIAGAATEMTAGINAQDDVFPFCVVDAATGLGIENVRILAVSHYRDGYNNHANNAPRILLTDSNGLALIPRGEIRWLEMFLVLANLKGFVPVMVRFEEPPQEEYVLQLEAAVIAAGVVVDEEGVPVQGVRLQAHGDNTFGQMGQPKTDFQHSQVETDASGRWTYHHIPPDLTDVEFSMDQAGYAGTFAIVRMGGPEATNARLVIKRGHTVVGTVIDEHGFPVVGAEVFVRQNIPFRPRTAKTGGMGEFLLNGLSTASARGQLQSDLPKSLVVQARGKVDEFREVDFRETTNRLHIVMRPGNRFRGMVVNENGEPVVNASVRAETWDIAARNPTRYWGFARTDAQGRFVWDSASEKSVRYTITASGYEPILHHYLSANDIEHHIVLRAIDEE